MITTKELGKKYWIHKTASSMAQEFWALRDINIEIQQGEVVGIIGPNGSGKSTFLKILSRVVHPSEGKVELLGRTGSLLEIGTGFHMELTGRENIFLAGAILGMKRKEIKRCFDPMISFSEVEEFLDIPVKKYSTGMFLRLAFSVMAYLESEILIVDEIIGIGDMSFQEKCLQKMQEMALKGKTILLVSHQLRHIQTLCSRVLWFEQGKCIADGETKAILESYESKTVLQV